MLVDTEKPSGIHSSVPPGIDLQRHAELRGRKRHVWWRWGALLVIAAIPVLGLLNVFGQRPQISRATSAQASLLLNSPSRVRGGLMFTTEIKITPQRKIRDGQLYLDKGWFQNMTLNGVSPQPSNQNAQGKWQTWDFGKMPANQTFTVWISWQVNPTNLGTRSQDLELYDGQHKVLLIHHTLTVFP